MRAFAEHRSYLPQLGVYAHSGKGFDFLAHWHPDVELFLVLEGTLTIGINGARRSLRAGELAVCASKLNTYPGWLVVRYFGLPGVILRAVKPTIRFS